MGREIRRVPANWEHPKDEAGHYKPLYDRDYETAARKWLDACIAWDNGTHEDLERHPEYKQEYPFFWLWDGNPPDPDTHRPKFESAEWYQIYETVSEGTPVTPPFASKEELVEYLVEHGDFWDQSRGTGGWQRQQAEQFVSAEWAPSLIVKVTNNSIQINGPRDGFGDQEEAE